MTPSITQIERRTIIKYIIVPQSTILFYLIYHFENNFSPQCDQKITCPVGQVLAIFTYLWIFFSGTGQADKH